MAWLHAAGAARDAERLALSLVEVAERELDTRFDRVAVRLRGGGEGVGELREEFSTDGLPLRTHRVDELARNDEIVRARRGEVLPDRTGGDSGGMRFRVHGAPSCSVVVPARSALGW